MTIIQERDGAACRGDVSRINAGYLLEVTELAGGWNLGCERKPRVQADPVTFGLSTCKSGTDTCEGGGDRTCNRNWGGVSVCVCVCVCVCV